jgi:hypothetical protein
MIEVPTNHLGIGRETHRGLDDGRLVAAMILWDVMPAKGEHA